ncbi:MAG: hypothetical protein AABY42_08010 [Nitrospirota bacterium]
MAKKWMFSLILSLVAGALFYLFPVSFCFAGEEKMAQDPDEDLPKLFIPRSGPAENFPCSKCHKYRPVNREKRKLVLNHTTIELKHAEKNRWCFDCHDGDKLRLPNGELVEYDKPYLLCGQCHGTIFRDWKAGIHGKTVGRWVGDKVFYVCVSCHDPHKPKFKQIEPEKQPLRPTEIKLIKK